MSTPSFAARLALAAALAAAATAPAFAQSNGKITKFLRPQVMTWDDKGAPAGQLAAKDVKLPADIVAVGTGNRLGIKVKDKIVFLRGLDVQTEGLKANCAPVQSVARAQGSSYAASNMGLGGAAVCK